MSIPLVSFVIATHNRRDVLLHTLGQVQRCGLSRREFEVLVVDNASGDETAAAVAVRFPSVILLRQAENLGACAKNVAMATAHGRYVVFLDDDSYPRAGSVARMMQYFETDISLGAAVFTITSPDGSQECSAYPNVCIGCGTGFRIEALREVGGLPDDFFMAAEEYDLSLRLLDAGWNVRRFDDLHVTHLKSPLARFPTRVTRLDVRNNLLLAMRSFPPDWRLPYAIEWMKRYRLIARAKGRGGAFWAGLITGAVAAVVSRWRPISPAAFEAFTRVRETEVRMKEAARRYGLRDVLFVDLGKNIFAYRRAAERCGLRVVAVADASLGGRRFRYNGIPIVSDAGAQSLKFDAAIVSNLSPVHAAARRAAWRAKDTRPVIDLFEQPAEREAKRYAVAA